MTGKELIKKIKALGQDKHITLELYESHTRYAGNDISVCGQDDCLYIVAHINHEANES